MPWRSTYAFCVPGNFTDEEVERAMPGDAEVAQANFQSTRAITMRAQATDIWPWLVQMGQGRGGLYTYTWLENMVGLRISNVDQILAEFQHLKVGDIIPLEAGGSGYRVGAIEPNQLLELVIQATDSGFMGTVMKQGDGASTWVYQLHELDSEHTRLIVRWRMRWNPSFKAPMLVLIRLLLAPVEFVMERKMILGIKKRAERVSVPIGVGACACHRPVLTKIRVSAPRAVASTSSNAF